jgi:hypothetical protein
VVGGGGGLTVSGVSRNRGGFVKCVAIQKRLGIPGLLYVCWSECKRSFFDQEVRRTLIESIRKRTQFLLHTEYVTGSLNNRSFMWFKI